MASTDDDSPPDRKGKKGTRKGLHEKLIKEVVVLREGVDFDDKMFKSTPIHEGPRLRGDISFTESMKPEDIEEVLKNAFPILAGTKRFFCAKFARKQFKLDACGEQRIWSGEVLNKEIKGNSLLYICCEKENSDQDPSLTAQMENMQISRNESSSEDRSDSGVETFNIPQERATYFREKVCYCFPFRCLWERSTVLGSLADWCLEIGEVKDPTSLEEVTSVPKDKQQTEEQSGEDESESFEETFGENQAISPSTIDKGRDSTSLEGVISVPMDKQQTEEQSGEDESESFKETLSVGPAAQDHDIKGKTTTFEAEHKECIRVLPYTNASGQVYVQLYVFCDKNSIPEELKEAAQEFFGETGVELRWTNLYNYASNIPNIVSKDFKQLEVSQANVISKIINKNLPVFSKHRNITAIQPSLKVTNLKQTNYPCIRVYVLGKGCIPVGESEIPNAVENFPVDIVDGFWLETLDTPKPLTAHEQEKCLRLGASIGVRGTKTAGTLGAIVKDDSSFYLLSCDHVINHEWEREIIHPGGGHYLNSLKYHLIDYQNCINRIIQPENRLEHNNLMPESIFEHLQNKVDSFYNAADVPRNPELEECKRKLDKLFSEKPRTVAYYTKGVRQNMQFSDGEECYIDAAIAELTDKEVEALKEQRCVKIIDTTNYPDGNVLRDGSRDRARKWYKSGSSTGYTTMESHFYLEKMCLKTAEHERPSFFPGNLKPPETYVGDDVWRINCMYFPHNQNVFSNLGDSGAVIFEKSVGQPQAMSGFGIVLGVFFSEAGCGTVAAPLLGALHLLSEKLGRRLELVSTF